MYSRDSSIHKYFLVIQNHPRTRITEWRLQTFFNRKSSKHQDHWVATSDLVQPEVILLPRSLNEDSGLGSTGSHPSTRIIEWRLQTWFNRKSSEYQDHWVMTSDLVQPEFIRVPRSLSKDWGLGLTVSHLKTRPGLLNKDSRLGSTGSWLEQLESNLVKLYKIVRRLDLILWTWALLFMQI